MITKKFQDLELPMLAFGAMRLPVTEDQKIDIETTRRMVDYAMTHGVNYFDIGWPYHGGEAEVVMGECLKAYPRESFYLADKYPGHQPGYDTNPARVFEKQLEKCQVEYFDFYLLHNVYEHDMESYENSEIIPYLLEQKKQGRIKHFGFSTHLKPENLRAFLEFCKEKEIEMELCVIQLNYLDWTLQEAKEKVEILNEYEIPIWVMEPLRGGKLAEHVSEAFRFLMDIPGVTVVMSGMSDEKQMTENIATFESLNPLSTEEKEACFKYAETLKEFVPCTACRYCTDGCPMGLNIPDLLSTYNEMLVGGFTPVMYLEDLPEEEMPSACIGCGACENSCPQSIPIPEILADLQKRFDESPKWKDICREREEVAKRMEKA